MSDVQEWEQAGTSVLTSVDGQDCHAEVEKQGHLDACGMPAVDLRMDTNSDDLRPWPACRKHAWPAHYIGGGTWVTA